MRIGILGITVGVLMSLTPQLTKASVKRRLSLAALPSGTTLPNGMPVTQFQLTNGLTIYVIENHSAPVFTYTTCVDVGSAEEKLDPRVGRTGLAHLFEHLMFRGTANHPDGEFD